ncbi:MAG TPA: patatin-like phospholipase family protein, partial [Flavobacteriia bacterium]|nr:patatin-like phospholipase family protein [Flavobacteriia bacterium]
GIAHIGVINVLQENGFTINAIAGTSMGAMVGGVFASGTLPNFQKWLEDADLKEAMKILDFSFSNPGFIKGEKLILKMQDFLPQASIENLPIPFTAIATDILKQKEVVFSKGDIFEAIRASISIPSVFTPLVKNDQVLVDGGLINNIPINHVQKNDDDIVVAVCVNSDIPMTESYTNIMQIKGIEEKNVYIRDFNKLRNYISNLIGRKKEDKNENIIGQYELIDRSIHMLLSEISNQIIKKYPPDILINLPRDLCGTFDFLKAKKIIEAGRLAALEQLKKLNLL